MFLTFSVTFTGTFPNVPCENTALFVVYQRGPSWSLLGILSVPLAPLGAPMRFPEVSLGGTALEPSWPVSVPSWRHCLPSWGHVGPPRNRMWLCKDES